MTGDCTVCFHAPASIQLDSIRKLCDKCAQLALDKLQKSESQDNSPKAVIERMERDGKLDTFSIESFKANGRGKDKESHVVALEYVSSDGNPGFRGCAPLIPGCVTIQRTLGDALNLVALCAESVDLRKE